MPAVPRSAGNSGSMRPRPIHRLSRQLPLWTTEALRLPGAMATVQTIFSRNSMTRPVIVLMASSGSIPKPQALRRHHPLQACRAAILWWPGSRSQVALPVMAAVTESAISCSAMLGISPARPHQCWRHSIARSHLQNRRSMQGRSCSMPTPQSPSVMRIPATSMAATYWYPVSIFRKPCWTSSTFRTMALRTNWAFVIRAPAQPR